MLEYIFKSVLLTSVIGTAFTALLTVFKPFTKKHFSESWHYYIWLSVLIIMIMPVRFVFPENIITHKSETIQEYKISYDEAATDEYGYLEENNSQHAELQITEAKSKKTVDIWNFLSALWLMGVFFVLSLKLTGYAIFKIKLRKNSEIIFCPEISKYTEKKIITRMYKNTASPFMLGFIKPILVLPETFMSEEQLKMVLSHEMTHFKRKDILYKWFFNIVKCIHWFNPVIYYIGKEINIECEVSCDASVTNEMTKEQKSEYVDTILMLLSFKKDKTSFSAGMADNKRVLKRRFSAIKNKIKISRKTAVVSVVIAVLLFGGVIFASGFLNGKMLNYENYEIIKLKPDDISDGEGNLLLIGVDEKKNADTVMVLTYRDSKITGISIPRDTAYGLDDNKKLSEILKEENGDQKAVDAVKNELAIPISYYAKIELSAVEKLVDIVGGVEVDVPVDMNYSDPSQNLEINLKKGKQLLFGKDIRGLLQYRRSSDGTGYTDGDMSRIKIGQQFISEFIKQKVNSDNLNKLPEILKTISDNIVTNFSVEEIFSGIKAIKDFEFYTLPGQNVSYGNRVAYKIDFDKASEILILLKNEDNISEYVLYFPDKEVMHLYPEKRKCDRGREGFEEFLLWELFKGTYRDDLKNSVSGDVRILSVNTVNGICTVDLSKEFLEYNTGGSAQESMAITSIVNTLCQLEWVDKVKINIEGDTNPQGGHFSLEYPYPANYKMIGAE